MYLTLAATPATWYNRDKFIRKKVFVMTKEVRDFVIEKTYTVNH